MKPPKGFETILSLALAILVATACDRMPRYSEFADISPSGWTPDEGLVFSPTERDSTLTGHEASLLWCIRFAANAPDSIRVVVEQESLETPFRGDTLTLPLRTDRELQKRPPLIPQEHEGKLRSRFRVPEGYVISITPLDTLAGLESIGIIIP